MSWRPNNWKNPYPKTITDVASEEVVSNQQYTDFEAGADVMLETLQAKAAIRLNNKWRVLLIPEEEEIK